MKLALFATLPLLLCPAVDGAAQTRPRAATPAPAAATTVTLTVTDLTGAPLSEVRVTMTGGLDRSGSTQSNGTVKFDGIRPGTYRLRLDKEEFVLLERELEIRAGQAAPNLSIALSPAPPAPPAPAPPPAPEPPKPAALPPPGKPMALTVPDFIERNFISGSQPQKVSTVGCSGLANTLLWQIREPWENKQHPDADAMLYVIGGEGTLRLDGNDTPLRAGSFASVPRGTTYSLTRRGRNPLILLATLAGEPCTQ
jgi:Carboxypeptidase regulatory-like domain/Cupin domain